MARKRDKKKSKQRTYVSLGFTIFDTNKKGELVPVYNLGLLGHEFPDDAIVEIEKLAAPHVGKFAELVQPIAEHMASWGEGQLEMEDQGPLDEDG